VKSGTRRLKKWVKVLSWLTVIFLGLFLAERLIYRTGYKVGFSEGGQYALSGMKSSELRPLKIYYAIDGEIDFALAAEADSVLEAVTMELGRAINSAKIYNRTGDIMLLRARVTGNRDEEEYLSQWLREDAQKEEAKRTNAMKLKTEGLTPPDTRD
jgi:hypothetical protein